MAKNSIRDYDATSGNNTDVQSVDISEGCAASGINNAIRELMADIKDVSTGAVNLETPAADRLDVDNIRIDGNTISSTDTNGNVNIDPAGTGDTVMTGSGGQVTIDENGHITSKQSLDAATAGGRIIGASNRGTVGQIGIEQSATGADGGHIHLSTCASGSTSPTERLRVDASGIVSIGNTIGSSFNSGANNLVVGTGSGSEGITIYGGNESNIFFADGTDIADNLRGRIEYSHLSEGMLFYVNNTYAGRIDSDTSLLLGTSSKGGSEKLALIGGPAFNIAHASTGTVGVFRTSGISGSIVGSISVSGSATAYNTSSDYRLKQGVQDMTGAIDRVKQLAPKRFNFIADADTTVDGFLAHEAQVVVPEAISGTKDETREVNNAVLSSDGRLLGEDITQAQWTAGKQATEKDGETIPAIYPSDSTWSANHNEPVMQGIDQSKLVPLLTGALQEAIAKIETLETKVAALENAE
jgi:hypothetical protein